MTPKDSGEEKFSQWTAYAAYLVNYFIWAKIRIYVDTWAVENSQAKWSGPRMRAISVLACAVTQP